VFNGENIDFFILHSQNQEIFFILHTQHRLVTTFNFGGGN